MPVLRHRRISAASFRPFGRIIELPRTGFPAPGKNLWRVIIRQPRAGWRIAYLVVRDKELVRLERHPGTWESFEPVRGRAALFVSLTKDPRSIRCFLLDRPVILKKGVWHGVVALDREADVKITENSSVACEFWRMPEPLPHGR